MPEISQNKPEKSPYWGNARYEEIQDKKNINISIDISENTDIAQRLAQENIQFFARNNEALGTTFLSVSKNDYEKASAIIENAAKKIAPEISSPQSWGNTKWSDINNKSQVIISNRTAEKINLGELLNKNSIPFSAREYADTQVTAVTVNKSDQNKVTDIIKKAVSDINQSHNQPVQNQSNEEKSRFSKIVVAMDMKADIGKMLLENDISFSSSTDTQSRTATFTVSSDNLSVLNNILKEVSQQEQLKDNISKEPEISEAVSQEPTKAAPVVEQENAEPKSTNEQVQDTVQKDPEINEPVPQVPTEAADIEEANTEPEFTSLTMKALSDLNETISYEISSRNIENSHYNEPVKKAMSLLEAIEKDTFEPQKQELNEVKSYSADMGKTVSPILSAISDKLKNSLERTAEKIDTLNHKIEKNQGRIEKLTDRADNLAHKNSMLTALKTVPFAAAVIDKIIEQNNREIEKINNVKIPKCKGKISKHEAKIEKNNIKLAKTMTRIKKVSALNKVVANFLNTNKEERQTEFISGMSELAQISLDTSMQKRDKAISELKEAASVSGRMSVNDIIIRNSDISDITETIEKHQNRVSKAKNLIENLTKVMNGELLQNKEDVDKMIDKAEIGITSAVIDNVSDISDDKGIGAVTEKITTNAVDVTSEIVNKAVTVEKEIEKEMPVQDNEKENPLKTVEELIEGNANSIDGIINNLPPEIENEEIADTNSDTDKTLSDPELVREERPENPEPIVTENKEQKIFNEIAAATGFTASQLNSLPKDIKSDIISDYEFSGGHIDSEQFAKDLAAILNLDPPKKENTEPTVNITSEESKEKIQKETQKDVDKQQSTDNSEKEKDKSSDRKPLFSLKDLFSEKFAPSLKKEHERENAPKRNNDRGL